MDEIFYPNSNGDVCEICDEFNDGKNNSFRMLFPPQKLKSRYLLHTDNFVALSGLGSLVPGYVLIFSKSHINNMGQLSMSQLNELEKFINHVKKIVSYNFSVTTVVFEHGDSSECSVNGSCIDHAHMHICPTTADFNLLPDTFSVNKIYSYSDLHRWEGLRNGYLFYESLKGELLVYQNNVKLESQFLRKLWAKTLSLDNEWDWALFPKINNILKTIEVFSGYKSDI